MISLTIPIADEEIHKLRVGDVVGLTGTIVTGRDTVHKWMIETFIRKTHPAHGDDIDVYAAIRPLLKGGVLYHCGPVVARLADGAYKFVAAGPTTSIREEPYQAEVIQHFDLRGVIGKGGMGEKTLSACEQAPAVYFHAIGGAASLIAQSVKQVLKVYKLDFGVPEAIWIIDVEDFPAVVTMDSHGGSLHANIKQKSQIKLNQLIRS